MARLRVDQLVSQAGYPGSQMVPAVSALLSLLALKLLDVVEVQADRLVIHFDKRSHNPLLREAALDRDNPPVPWLRNLPIIFTYP